MTVMELDVRPVESADFNPLVELAGRWNTRLADDFESYLGARFGRWECFDGRLVVAPAEASSNVWGETSLARILYPFAKKSGLYVLGSSINMSFSSDTWIQPDLSVLHRIPGRGRSDKWVPVDHFTMAIEFLSPSTRYQDEKVKPDLLASAGVPFYMLVDIDRALRSVVLTQYKLIDGHYQEIARAAKGVFTMVEPFEASFAVSELLFPDGQK